MSQGSKKVVVAALIGNLLIALSKFVVAFLSGSTALFAEAVHSTADTGNQILLLVGMRLSLRPADVRHPFGYGQERYFWALMVAVTMFVVGAVVSLYHGIHKILEPQPIEHVGWIYLVLGLSALFESYPLFLAYKTLRESHPEQPLWRTLNESKRPAVIVVFMEDAAAMCGIFLAFLGVVLATYSGYLIFDGIASVCIGVLLALVAFSVAFEIKSLLIGEAVSKENYERILKTVNDIDEVEQVLTLLTMHLGPEEVLVNLNVAFIDGLETDAIEALVDRIENHIQQVVPEAKQIFIEADTPK